MRFKTVTDHQVVQTISHLLVVYAFRGQSVDRIDLVREFGEALGYTTKQERLQFSNRVHDAIDRIP